MILGFILALGFLQPTSPIAGVWTLNKSASQIPQEIGFNANWLPSPGERGQDSPQPSSGSRGRRGSSGSGSRGGGNGMFGVPRESYDDARRVQLFTNMARNPPARLMIVDTPAAITFTNELGQPLVLHPDGKQETPEYQGMLLFATTKREGDQLVVVYDVEKDREVRYTYSRNANPPQLIVDVQFLDHGEGDKAKYVYDAGVDTPTRTAPGAPANANVPATGGAAREKFDETPGAELKGIKTLGILVEDLGQTAIACGLKHDTLEAAISKRLTDAGFTVRRNSDDDTYVYVNIATSSVGTGTCVSRFDVFLYTHATAKVSYHEQPVLVQVSLIHRGGLSGTTPSTHLAAVQRGLEDYVDLMVTQIRDANK
ncbi:MAG TPA: hypothetical protein VFA59_14070 [Vicinamibacterales bacterium]|nr:hypothetical protein [Vicinamibacterales bacterium]